MSEAEGTRAVPSEIYLRYKESRFEKGAGGENSCLSLASATPLSGMFEPAAGHIFVMMYMWQHSLCPGVWGCGSLDALGVVALSMN